MLDSAGYGVVTVNKSVSIIALAGVYPGISDFAGQDGVTITAGASDKVVLRGPTINGQGGNQGIVINQAGQVNIERCIVSNMGAHGILLEAGASKVSIDETRVTGSSNSGVFVRGGDLVLTQSQIENNSDHGVVIIPTTFSTVHMVVRGSLVDGNAVDGIVAGATTGQTVQVTVEDTSSLRNIGNGFLAATDPGGVVTFVLSGSVASRNGGVGFYATGTGTTASVSGSTLARNYTFDIRQSGATLRSHGNNALSGDGPGNVSGTITQVGLN